MMTLTSEQLPSLPLAKPGPFAESSPGKGLSALVTGRDSTPATASSLAPSSLTGWAPGLDSQQAKQLRLSQPRPFGLIVYPRQPNPKRAQFGASLQG